jgi:hypothetical protein
VLRRSTLSDDGRLLPLLVFIAFLIRDRDLLGEHAAGPRGTAVVVGLTALIAAATLVLAVLSLA